MIGAGFEAGHAADGIDQRLPVMRPGAADESAVNVEEDQRGI
jgi:hypothetical protein